MFWEYSRFFASKPSWQGERDMIFMPFIASTTSNGASIKNLGKVLFFSSKFFSAAKMTLAFYRIEIDQSGIGQIF